MSEILSIQSHVAYGYVGNRAAVFPLQRLGFDVTAINTVQFSNHTGYGQWQGDVMTAEHIDHIINGLRQRDLLRNFSAVLTGYLGDVKLGEIILKAVAEIRQHNPDLIYCCDPVMGDVGRGFFVREGLPEFFKHQAVPQADMITPNKFEAEYLTGHSINNLDDALQACAILSDSGAKIILITSLETDETPVDHIQMLAYFGHERYLVTTPKFKFNVAPNGAGDVTAAIFLGDYLKNKNLQQALEHVSNSVFSILKQTYDNKTRELQLIPSQHAIVAPEKQAILQKI